MSVVNVNEAITKIKQVGATNARCVPMSGQDANTGNYQIEVCESGSWHPIATGLPKNIAEDIVRQATNRVILG